MKGWRPFLFLVLGFFFVFWVRVWKVFVWETFPLHLSIDRFRPLEKEVSLYIMVVFTLKGWLLDWTHTAITETKNVTSYYPLFPLTALQYGEPCCFKILCEKDFFCPSCLVVCLFVFVWNLISRLTDSGRCIFGQLSVVVVDNTVLETARWVYQCCCQQLWFRILSGPTTGPLYYCDENGFNKGCAQSQRRVMVVCENVSPTLLSCVIFLVVGNTVEICPMFL